VLRQPKAISSYVPPREPETVLRPAVELVTVSLLSRRAHYTARQRDPL
jgi:hypothetical protein